MKRTIALTIASALLLGLGAGACSEGPSAPDQQVETEDLEARLLETTGIAEDQANGSSVVPSSARSDVSLASVAAHGDCTFSASTGRFTCPDLTRNGVTITRSYALYDAAGAAQSRRDSATVKVNTQVWARGTVATDSTRATIDRRSDLTATGVQPSSPSRTLNGTEQGTLSFEKTTSRGKLTSTTVFGDTTTGLVIPHRDATRKWPLAGTVIRSHSVTRGADGSSPARTVTHRAVFTYDGSAIVKVTLTVNGVTRSCTRNLETREQHCTQ